MPLTSEQVKAIQDSFAKVVPISEQAAEIFYGRLFEIAPAVKPLFRGDMKQQGKKLMDTFTFVVNYTVLSDFMIGEAYGHKAA